MKEGILDDTSILQVPEIKEAVNLLEESSFSKGELYGYDKCWDNIRSVNTLIDGSFKEGREGGRIEAGKVEIARQLKKLGVNINIIMQSTGLSERKINDL